MVRKCVATFGECKKYEDSSVHYIYNCMTRSRLLVKILASLRTAKVVLENVKAKANDIFNITTGHLFYSGNLYRSSRDSATHQQHNGYH